MDSYSTIGFCQKNPAPYSVLIPENSALKIQGVGSGLFILKPIRTTLSEIECLPAVNHTGTTQPYYCLQNAERNKHVYRIGDMK